MNTKSSYTRLNLGKIFSFTIIKEVTLPDSSNQEYYIIADVDNYKFTLPKKHYQHLGFKPGISIQCKLDRINCSGQIFFEPVNPHYSTNQNYNFRILKQITLKNYLGINELVLVVADFFGKKQHVHFLMPVTNINTTIVAYVLSIKKGELFLVSDSWAQQYYSGSNPAAFTITGSKNTKRFGDAHLLCDSFGNTHILPKIHYKNYKLKPGEPFLATVKGVSSKGFLYIEPEHLIYKKGMVKKFEVIDLIEAPHENTLFVEDCYGNMIKVIDQSKRYRQHQKISCVISEINKGKPELTHI